MGIGLTSRREVSEKVSAGIARGGGSGKGKARKTASHVTVTRTRKCMRTNESNKENVEFNWGPFFFAIAN